MHKIIILHRVVTNAQTERQSVHQKHVRDANYKLPVSHNYDDENKNIFVSEWNLYTFFSELKTANERCHITGIFSPLKQTTFSHPDIHNHNFDQKRGYKVNFDQCYYCWEKVKPNTDSATYTHNAVAEALSSHRQRRTCSTSLDPNSQTATRSSGLPFSSSTPVIHVIT